MLPARGARLLQQRIRVMQGVGVARRIMLQLLAGKSEAHLAAGRMSAGVRAMRWRSRIRSIAAHISSNLAALMAV